LNTAKTQEWFDGTTENYGVILKKDTEINNANDFGSREAPSGYCPYFLFSYDTPSNYTVRIKFYDALSGGSLISSIEICTENNAIALRELEKSINIQDGLVYAELVIEATRGAGFYVDSISIESFKSIHFTDKGVSVQGNFLVNGSAKTVTDRFYNKSGVQVVEGDVVILDTGSDRAFKTTTTPGSFAVLGVVKETIANDALGALATTAGEVAIVHCDTIAVAIGDYLKTSATAKLATSNGRVITPNCFAKALSSKASGSVGTVYCMILDHNPVVATPAEISSLIAWYRPEELSGYAEGGLLAQWNDASGNGNHILNATASAQPVVRKSTLNGLDVVQFVSADQLATAAITGIGGANSLTLISVFKRVDGDASIVFGLSGTSESTIYAIGSGSSGDPCIHGDGVLVSGPTLDLTAYKIGCVIRSGNSSLLYKNNGLFNSGTESRTTIANILRMGRKFSTSGYYWHGYIAEAIMYNKALSTDERNAVHEYLSNKYGITLS
jgi:hypothetical protein